MKLSPLELKDINLLEKFNLSYTAIFVPFSQSRNKDKEHPSLNWLITISRGHVKLTTDYMQGSGHILKTGKLPKAFNSYHQNQIETLTCETGKLHKYYSHMDRVSPLATKGSTQPPPPLNDIIWSLSLDASVLDHPDFESWASEFGYETDSRSAEATYKACLEIAIKFNLLFNCQERDLLQELFQDY